MKKSKEKIADDTQLNEDLDAFEEWEESEGVPKQVMSEPELEPEPKIAEGEPEPAFVMETPTASRSLADELAELAPDVPVNLVAVVGKTTINVGELMKYRIGQVVDLGRAPGETVDLVANGRLIARGELVEMDGKMGVRILKMVR